MKAKPFLSAIELTKRMDISDHQQPLTINYRAQKYKFKL